LYKWEKKCENLANKISQFLSKSSQSLILTLVFDCLPPKGQAVKNQTGKGFGNYWRGLLDFLPKYKSRPEINDTVGELAGGLDPHPLRVNPKPAATGNRCARLGGSWHSPKKFSISEKN
jgi:hypothetical protein